jgi:hypothetical protein
MVAGMVIAGSPTLAAEVTPERLINADREPQNWLMNHRTYDGQRFSPLARINRDNVKNLRLAYAVPLAGGAGNEFTNATPLAEDGFLYVTDWRAGDHTAAGAEEPDVFNANGRRAGCKALLADNICLEGALEAGYCRGVIATLKVKSADITESLPRRHVQSPTKSRLVHRDCTSRLWN